VFPSDEHYKEYLEDVSDYCSEDGEETNGEEDTTEDGQCIIYQSDKI
jgi:hypothetical protein